MRPFFVRFVAIFLALILPMPFVASQTEADPPTASVLDRIRERGVLVCGANVNLPGFGIQDMDGNHIGFDNDICRAVATAILDDPNAVQFVGLDADERAPAFADERIDMMSRNTTFTLSRDADWGVIFGPTTFYDGQGVMARADLGVLRIEALEGKAICVEAGTTTELNINDFVFARNLDIEIQVYPSLNRAQDAYISGRCAAFTTDKSGLASFRSLTENPDDHVILAQTISKEPLGPLSPQRDEHFAEIIRWTVYGLIQAEEFGITSDNIAEFLPGNDESNDAYVTRVGPGVARFLGQANQEAGSLLGIDNDFMVSVIRAVGNYGELYERYLAPLGLERARTVNDLWVNGGLLYAPPFR